MQLTELRTQVTGSFGRKINHDAEDEYEDRRENVANSGSYYMQEQMNGLA